MGILEVLELCIQFQFDYKRVYLCECMLRIGTYSL